MSGTRAAIRYAKAILSIAKDSKRTAMLQDEMNHLSDTIAANAELDAVLKSPVVKLSEKRAVLDNVFNESSSSIKALFQTLAQNKRFDLLQPIAIQYNRLCSELNNKEEATVTTAVPMTETLEKKVMAKLKTLSDKDVTLTKIVDETILGGFILRIGDQQYNASVSNQLNEIKNKFITN